MLTIYLDILIYCNETLNLQPTVKSKLKLRNKIIAIESKKKLLNVLNEIDLNQRYNHIILYEYKTSKVDTLIICHSVLA